MIKPWIFEFLYAPHAEGAEAARQVAAATFDQATALWQRLDALDFEGIFTSRPPS